MPNKPVALVPVAAIRVMPMVSAVVPSPAVAAVPASEAETPPSVVPEAAAVVPPAAPENSTLEVAVALV